MNLIYNEIYHPILLWYIACIPKYGKHQLHDKLTEELEPIRNGKIFEWVIMANISTIDLVNSAAAV